MRVATSAVLCALAAVAFATADATLAEESRELSVHVKISSGVASSTTTKDKPAAHDFSELDFDSDDGEEDDGSDEEDDGDDDDDEDTVTAAPASANAMSTTNSTKTSNTTAMSTITSAETVGRQKCSVMSKYNWIDFTHACEWFHADSGYNIFYRRKDNASFVYECECNKNLEETYGPFSASKWTWTKSGSIDCFSRYGKDVANVVGLFDSAPVCKSTNKKYCDTKTDCTYW